MEQVSSLLCSLSLCGLLFCCILLLLPLQSSSTASQPLSEPRAATLCQFPAEQLDRVEIFSSSDNFCFINYGNCFLLEGMENIPLQENALSDFLKILEDFPTGKPSEPPESPPILKIDITPVSEETIHLDFFDDESNIFVSNRESTQIISSEKLSPLFQPVEKYIQKTIFHTTPSNEGSFTISGDCHKQPVLISYYYVGKNQNQIFAQLTGSYSQEIPKDKMTEIMNSLCNLQAESVLKFDPTEQDLQKYGLNTPFLEIHADFQGEHLNLCCSRPSKDGEIFLLKNNIPIIYMIKEENVPWLSLCPESITEKEVFSIDYIDCTTMILSTPDQKYRFTKWDGNVLCGSRQIKEELFSDFFELSTQIIPSGIALREQSDETPLLTLHFSYTNPEKPADILSFYPYDNKRLRLSINNDSRYLCEKEKAVDIIRHCEALFR